MPYESHVYPTLGETNYSGRWGPESTQWATAPPDVLDATDNNARAHGVFWWVRSSVPRSQPPLTHIFTPPLTHVLAHIRRTLTLFCPSNLTFVRHSPASYRMEFEDFVEIFDTLLTAELHGHGGAGAASEPINSKGKGGSGSASVGGATATSGVSASGSTAAETSGGVGDPDGAWTHQFRQGEFPALGGGE